MATLEAIAKKTNRQIEAILTAIEKLKSQSVPAELVAEFDDGGILEEIKGIVVSVRDMQHETNVILNSLRADIVELQQPKKRGRKTTVAE